MNEISRGTIFENLWAGHKTYFVYDHTKISRNQTKIAIGCEIINLDGKWIFGKNACYYKKDLLDNEHFPVVGHIDMADVIIRAILNEVKKGDSDD